MKTTLIIGGFFILSACASTRARMLRTSTTPKGGVVEHVIDAMGEYDATADAKRLMADHCSPVGYTITREGKLDADTMRSFDPEHAGTNKKLIEFECK